MTSQEKTQAARENLLKLLSSELDKICHLNPTEKSILAFLVVIDVSKLIGANAKASLLAILKNISPSYSEILDLMIQNENGTKNICSNTNPDMN